jgi:predicted RND superfamily exporter protein
MQKKILDYIFNLSLKRGKVLLISMALISIILGSFIPRLKISSSQQDLIPRDHPEQAKFIKFQKEFGVSDNLIVVLEGEGDVLKEYADHFADEILKEKKWVKSVFFKIDASTLIKSAPLYFPLKDLQRGLDLIKKKKNLIEKMQKISSLHELLVEISNSFKDPNTEVSIDAATKIVSFFNALFLEWNEWLTNPNQVKLRVAEKLPMADFAQISILQSGGYLFSRDFKMLFIMVQPNSYSDEITYLRPFMADMRKACDRALEVYPDLKNKIKYAYTGMPAHVLTETEIIYSDVGSAGIVSVIIVSLILLIGFRSFKKMIIGVIPTVAGLFISLGLITIIIGRLNLISSSFLAVLFGIGIDFGIYLLQRTEEELGNRLPYRDAVYTSVVLTSRSIISGGLTTCLAFFALSLSKFVGFSELGLAAGIGLLVVLFTTFLMIPSLLLLIPIEPRDYHLRETIVSAKKPQRKKRYIAIVGVSVVLTLFSVYAAMKVKMDYNVLKLMPRDTESTIYQQKMEEHSDFKMSSAVITERDFNTLKNITEKAQALPTVSRVDSLAGYIPTEQDEKIKIIKKIKPLLGKFQIILAPNDYTNSDYITVLEQMKSYFEEAQEKAFAGNQTKLVEQIEKLIININSIVDKLSSKNKEQALARTKRFEKELFVTIGKATQIIRESFNPVKISEKTFPKEIIGRFKSAEGNYAAFVYPNGSIWDVSFLDKFIVDLKNITSNVTGFPVTHRVYVRQAADAILWAMIYSFVIILILLIIDFRRVDGVVLSLVPLFIGMMWLQLVMFAMYHILDLMKSRYFLTYNVADLAGLPLLLGLGIVYGLRMVHRWKEDIHITAYAATKTTGRGLAFAALAIITGLFSIIPARHKGVSDFGVVLLIGIVLCLCTALFILPAVIDLIYVIKYRHVNGTKAPVLVASGEEIPEKSTVFHSQRKKQAESRKVKTKSKTKSKTKKKKT